MHTTYHKLLVIPEGDDSGERPIDSGCSNREQPRRRVLHRLLRRPIVPSRHDDRDAVRHGVQRARGLKGPADGDGQHVDAVMDGMVDALKDAGAGAGRAPAGLVHGHPGARRAAAGRPGREPPEEADVVDDVAARRGRRVCAVAPEVPGGQEIALERAPVDVAPGVPPGADELPVAVVGAEIGPGLACSLPS